jgi:ribosome-associated protein
MNNSITDGEQTVGNREGNGTSVEVTEQLERVVRALASKKAQDITVLELRGLTIIADYFVIATGTSSLHIRALVDAVLADARTQGIKGIRPEGESEATWVLVDLGDVVVHIFDAEHRDFYQLERLWADAPRVPMPEDWLK